MNWSVFKRYCWLLPCVLAILAYANSLHNGWHFDDNHSILQNKAIRSLDNCFRFFVDAKTFSSKDVKRIMYRPLLLVGYALTYAAGGFHLPLWHTVQILLHVICVYLVYCFLLRLCNDKGTAFIATTLYAVHPIHTHALNYLCSRSEIQASIFMLGSLLLAMKSCDGKRKWLYQGLALLCLAAALLTKAIAVMVPFLYLLWDLWLGKGSKEDGGWKGAVTRFLPLLLLVLLYLLLRKMLLDSVVLPIAKDASAPGLRLFKDHPFEAARGAIGGRSIFTNLLVQATALWTYIYLFFWPPALSPIHDISPSTTLFSWPTAVTVPLSLALVFLLFYLRRRRPLVSFCGFFFLLAIAPTSLIPLNLIVNEHRVYLASVTVFLLLAKGLQSLADLVPGRHSLTIITTVVVVLLFFSTVHRNTYWRSSAALWADAKEKAPKARFVHNEYAVALFRAGFIEEALWEMESSFRLHPFKEPGKWINVGGNHIQLGNLLLARKYLRAALQETKDDKRALLGWVVLLIAADRPEKAKRQLESILLRYENCPHAKHYLQQVNTKLVNLRNELKSAKALVKSTNRSVGSLFFLAKTYARLGKREQALSLLNELLTIAPNLHEPLVLKGKILVNSESFAEAISPLANAAKSSPQTAMDLLCMALGGAGKVKEAQDVAKKMLADGISLSLQARYFAQLPPFKEKEPEGWVTKY